MVAVLRRTTRLEKSASPGLVQLTVTCASPGVAPAPVLVLVNAVMVPVTA